MAPATFIDRSLSLRSHQPAKPEESTYGSAGSQLASQTEQRGTYSVSTARTGVDADRLRAESHEPYDEGRAASKRMPIHRTGEVPGRFSHRRSGLEISWRFGSLAQERSPRTKLGAPAAGMRSSLRGRKQLRPMRLICSVFDRFHAS